MSGIAHPNYKHGKYSEVLPTRMRESFERAVSDPELLNLTREIAVTDARLLDLLDRVDSGESGRLWALLGKLRVDFLDAQRKKDQDRMAEALADLLREIGRGHSDFAIWDEVQQTMERRRRLVESEQKRRVQMHLLVKLEDATVAMDMLADSLREAVLENVSNPSEQRAVLSSFQSALNRLLT